MKRRSFLKGSLASSTLVIAASAGLLQAGQVMAAVYPQAAFDADAANDALSVILGGNDATDSDDIVLTAPVQAENGAVVPLKVEVSVQTEAVAIVVDGNPKPLVLAATLAAGSKGFLSGRIKMGKTSMVVAYAKTPNGLIKASQEIKVTVGGCGG
ncbi:MAG: thiosulfate oxidation carrier protein SoxY [Methylococcales bacterium]|nr:thiosulfate oxidation carrier protein SoxY [Methylococcales bacterium]